MGQADHLKIDRVMRRERRQYPNCGAAHRAGEVLEGVLLEKQEAVEFDEVGGPWVQL